MHARARFACLSEKVTRKRKALGRCIKHRIHRIRYIKYVFTYINIRHMVNNIYIHIHRYIYTSHDTHTYTVAHPTYYIHKSLFGLKFKMGRQSFKIKKYNSTLMFQTSSINYLKVYCLQIRQFYLVVFSVIHYECARAPESEEYMSPPHDTIRRNSIQPETAPIHICVCVYTIII